MPSFGRFRRVDAPRGAAAPGSLNPIPMHVLLFDIDGTLINTRGSGLTALQLAFTEAFGHPAPSVIDTCGRTDRGIARDLFLAHRLADSSDNWEHFHQLYLRHLATQLPQRDGHILPGVTNLLQDLARRPNLAIGLLTGNTPEGAKIKLRHFGIDHHFGFGGYGHLHPERNVVAEAALHAARQRIPCQVALDRVWVIGDTPRDIACARHIGARAVAVATGFHDRTSLAGQNPDVLLDDFREAGDFLSWLEVGVA